jgi:hypothetical protein
MGTQPSGGSSVPKISAVPVTRRKRRSASGSTSTRSSLCGGCGVAGLVAAAAAMGGDGVLERARRRGFERR